MLGKTTMPEGEQATRVKVRLLTYVLCYDDLLDPKTETFLLGSRSRKVMIGRGDRGQPWYHADTGLRIGDRWMSREHAVIEHVGNHDMIRDAKSRNGTYVNGNPIGEHLLENGDLIEVGHSLICYRVVDGLSARALAEERLATRAGLTPTYSPKMAMLMRDLRSIAPSPESVLLLAETGAGKEIAASVVHQLSGRPGEFCAVDCGAIPDSLFESTFFGHLRGAFTGATEPREGEIVRADGGTLFLDEVGNMSPTAQAKLLRVIETGQLTPLGASKSRSVDVRWVAATNRNVYGDDGFRSDLLRRLAGYTGRIPPLRDRREDLGVLSEFILRDAGIERASITAAAGRMLFNSPLPGNVRQLRATLRSGAVLARNGPIDVVHLPELESSSREISLPSSSPGRPSAPAAKKRPSAEVVSRALADTRGNVVRAAELLGTHPRQVYRWLKRYSLSLDDYRD